MPGTSRAAKKTAAAKTTPKRSTANKATTKKTTAKKATAKKATAKKTTAKRKYSRATGAKVGEVMDELKAGTLRSGRSGTKVTSRRQAIAIGLSEARAAGEAVAPNPNRRKKTS